MVINPPSLSVTSAVRNQFLQPLLTVFAQVTSRRKCPVESDLDWLLKGVDRVLSNQRRGRDFLQTFQMFWAQPMQVGPYFETLASPRRLAMVAECSGLLRARVDAVRASPLAAFTALPLVKHVLGAGDTRSSIITVADVQIDLRVLAIG